MEIARATSEGAGVGGRVEAWQLDQARQVLGGFADATTCDRLISGELARRELGWRPLRPSILEELWSYAADGA